MNKHIMQVIKVIVISSLFFILGCASAYDHAYQQEMQKLETQEQAQQAEERAAHLEAQKYAAVVYFDSGSAVIKEKGYIELKWFADKMQPYPKAIIQIQGLTDSKGSESKNQRLSEQRANAVADYLNTLGISYSRMAIQGFASEFPADTNKTKKGLQNNRRVEVTVR